MANATLNQPKREDLALTAVLYALSDEVRLQIVERLNGSDEIACGYFDISRPKSSMSHHFRVLRTSGVIATRREGTALLNRLRTSDLNARFPGLLDSVLAATREGARDARFAEGSVTSKGDRPALARSASR